MPHTLIDQNPASASVLPTSRVLTAPLDENLFLTAESRCRDSHEQMLSLMDRTPTVRAAINQRLKRTWNLEGEQAGLLFHATAERSTRRSSLSEACAFMLQHPQLDTALIPGSQLTGIHRDHPLFATPSAQLLEQFKALDLKAELTTLWNDYWSARAPGTPLSRRDLAVRLYRSHFEAAGQLAFAQGALSTEQLAWFLAALNPPDAALEVAGQRICTEQLTLTRSDTRVVPLPGAFVISREAQQLATQLLYLPQQQPAVKRFRQRSEMEDWLIEHQQQVFGVSESAAENRITYNLQETALNAGLAQLLAHRLTVQMLSAIKGRDDDIAEYAAYALDTVEQLEQTHRTDPLFSAPPALAITTQGDAASDEAPLFGLLNPDIPMSRRRHSLAQQCAAIEQRFAQDPNDPQLQKLKQALDALNAAQQASRDAASALLDSRDASNLLELRHPSNPHYTALYQARLRGLRAEAEIQWCLGQISLAEHDLITAIVDDPDRLSPHPHVTVARLTLSSREQPPQDSPPHTRELEEVLLITHPSAEDGLSPPGQLLYWPGHFGGLQRFASRQALEQELFKLGSGERVFALHVTALSRAPFKYALDNQLHACEQQVIELIQNNPLPAHAAQRRLALEKLREQMLATLTVPVSAARDQAYARHLEQHRSDTLTQALPQWLKALAGDQRVQLKRLIQAYIAAMKRSHEILERDLPPRADFSNKHLETRLRKDFNLKHGFAVVLDLPDSTTWQKRVIQGAAPGTPQESVLVASPGRSPLSLVELAQRNIDQPLWWRLSLMRCVISADDETDRKALSTGINPQYLRALVTELDLAAKYEQLIRETFIGLPHAAAFSNEHRRECLVEPWRLMLKLQGEFAQLQRHIDAGGRQVLEIAIDAASAQAYAPGGKRIVLIPAHLTVGGADTPSEGPSTLSGVTFIEEQISGLTLLYLPDSPDGEYLRQFPSLEQARQRLFDLCVQEPMVEYLAGRALTGNFAHHVSRIKQAQLNNFDALIGTGQPWPASTSLAAHLLNVHMGRLIEAHRATARSNDALYLELCALKSGAMFNYLKMAVGMVPFVGSALALYDAWDAANLAVAAFLRGDVGQGLAEVESVLLSLIDAAMDIFPAAGVGSSAAPRARALTRIRQLKALVKDPAALHTPLQRPARQAVERFLGYEYEQPISLASLQPGSDGMYRNVYRHADGNFIVRQGRIYQIEWSTDSRNWRLSGTRRKTYKQPIGLNEAGHWDTYYHAHGVTFEGGGLGGGAVLGRLADGLDPIWPEAIRERLPRWWTDRVFRRHHTLTAAADDLAPQLDAQVARTNTALDQYNSSTADNRPALRQVAEAACTVDIEMATRHYQTLVELLPLTHGNKRRTLLEIQSNDALILADRFQQRLYISNHRAVDLLNRTDELIRHLDTLPDEALTERLRALETIRTIRLAFIGELDTIDAQLLDFHLWLERVTVSAQKSQLIPTARMLTERLSAANRLYLKTGHLLEVINRFDSASEVSWLYLQTRANPLRTRVDRALFSQFSLPETSATKAQRNQILQDCIDAYAQFRREMNVWTASYPQHFHLEAVPPLIEGLEKMAERARKAIAQPTSAAIPGQRQKKVFTTEDNQLLIGTERWEPTTQTRQYVLTGKGGYTEVWEQGSHERFRLLNPPPQTSRIAQHNLDALISDARQRLESQASYQAKVQAYAAQDMLPVDLEHMMLSEANELLLRARHIEQVAPDNTILSRLRDKAAALTAQGRQLRTQQTLRSKNPTDGMLDDLARQNAVDIRKTSPMKNLGKRKDGRIDYLQEYEIHDLAQTPSQVLWYAHFHYTKATPDLRAFEKAHLKLPEHRFATHADAPNLPYSDIAKHSVALIHFENL